ncbi:MAG TPA: single-stranded-DNA-specific exonuclease RecJ [Candidatus Paceibacterota bacterium]|nr:single-stranded-DNA-specific exonuclease RecJ [Candidatus Paceibacterota bacterium]
MKSYKLRERLHENLLDDLLLSRGIEGEEAVKNFLSPDFERDSHDPFLFPDIDAAVERILAARKSSEVVCVWSDYDCDGIPGGVMLTQFLRGLGMNVIHYIPHRHREGYGLNVEGIDSLKAQNVSLMITIDLGTTEHERIEYAKQKGIDTIVTDHHIVQEGDHVPALAFINPKRPDSKYPFDGLSGAGVAWKLIQAILKKERGDVPAGHEKWFLDLVGLSTLSDMVPLVGENRMLAKFGLTVMQRNRRPGFAALLKVLKIRPSALTEDDIGFMISPRINAASRMDSPDIAAKLLAATDEEEAQALAKQLNHINDERKGLVAATVKEANHRLKEMEAESPVIVMGNPKWRPGILGLVANKLAEAHGKPVFLWGREGGEMIRGSVRSGDEVSVVDIMSGAADAFTHFGGHHASGGFAVDEAKVHELLAKLNKSYETLRAKGVESRDTMLEREVALSEVSQALRTLSNLAPFGVGNSKPLFLFPRVEVARMKMFGKQSDHIEVSLANGGSTATGIAFFSTPDSFSKPLAAGNKVDVVGHIETDWRGGPRIRVVDVI